MIFNEWGEQGKGILTGIISGLIASFCCLTPVVLIFFGLGSVSFAFSFIHFKVYFLLLSWVFILFAFILYWRRRSCAWHQALRSRFVISTVFLHLLIFLVSFYLFLPYVGGWVFRQRLFNQKVNLEDKRRCWLVLQVRKKDLNTLSCASCEAALRYQLEQEKGILEVEVNFQKESKIYYDQQQITSEEILKLIPADYFVQGQPQNQC